MALTEALARTLAMTAEAVAEAANPWWIIGSAAVALHGAEAPGVRDVDLLMSARDAEQTLRRLGAEIRAGAPSPRFRSAVFGVWSAPPLPVEIMGGFRLATAGGWRAVRPQSRQPFRLAGRELFAPSAAELGGILRAFGRPKDLERLRLLGG